MTIRIKSLQIDISTLLLLVFALLFDFAEGLLLVYFFVMLHEIAHLTAAKLTSAQIEYVKVQPFGVTIKLRHNTRQAKEEIAISLTGPLFSLSLGLLLLYFYYTVAQSEMLLTCAFTNLAIGIINLIPALPLDGGRALRAYLSERIGFIRAFNLSVTLTKICIVLIITAGAALLVYSKFNFSLILVGAFLAVNLIAENRAGKLSIMKEISQSRDKLSAGAQPAQHLAIMWDKPARSALKQLSPVKYCLIDVVGKDMSVMGTVTETALIECLTEKGIRVKAADVVERGVGK